MTTRLTRRKGVALLATAGLAAGVVGVMGVTPAGAVAQTATLFCSPTNLAPAGTPDIPFTFTIDATAPSTAFPTGESISLSNVTGVVTWDPQSTGGFAAQGATGLGLGQGLLALTATSTQAPQSKVNVSATGITTSVQPITGFNPTGGPGGTPIANPLSIPFSATVAYPSWITAGANGGSVQFSIGDTGSGFQLMTPGLAIPSLGTGTLNAGTGGPGAGNCTTFIPAAGPIATTSLVDPGPAFTAPVGTQTVSNAATAAIQVTATDSSPTSVIGSTWALTTNASNGNVTLGSAGASGTTSTAVFNYTANSGFIGADSFVVAVGDGVSTSTYTINLNVVGGDAGNQGVNQQINGGYLDVDACGFGPSNDTAVDPAFTEVNCQFTMTPITLDGSNQVSTGSFNDLTVNDARGTPVPWSLTAQLAGPLVNATSYAGNNDEIAAANLVMGTPTCLTQQGLNPNPTPGGGGSLDTVRTVCSTAAGSNGGRFLADAGVTLNVPASTFAGSYFGVINFIVA